MSVHSFCAESQLQDDKFFVLEETMSDSREFSEGKQNAEMIRVVIIVFK